MVILGLDPGSTRVGYGLVHKEGGRLSFLDAGILSITSRDASARLIELEQSLADLLTQHTPRIVGVEKLFFVRNMKTAIAVSQSRGVILLTLAKHRVPLVEYTPLEVKRAITGHGMAPKQSVASIAARILRIPPLKLPDDATDALAIAIITSMHLRR